MSCILILAQASSGILDSAKETAETFGWNPWLFLSQVISFTIVALLLRRFAYKPILQVLEERRQQIAAGLLNAEKIKKQLAEAEQRHAEILAKANAVAQKMIDDARDAITGFADDADIAPGRRSLKTGDLGFDFFEDTAHILVGLKLLLKTLETVAHAAVPNIAANAKAHSAEQLRVHDKSGIEVVTVLTFQIRDDFRACLQIKLGRGLDRGATLFHFEAQQAFVGLQDAEVMAWFLFD